MLTEGFNVSKIKHFFSINVINSLSDGKPLSACIIWHSGRAWLSRRSTSNSDKTMSSKGCSMFNAFSALHCYKMCLWTAWTLPRPLYCCSLNPVFVWCKSPQSASCFRIWPPTDSKLLSNSQLWKEAFEPTEVNRIFKGRYICAIVYRNTENIFKDCPISYFLSNVGKDIDGIFKAIPVTGWLLSLQDVLSELHDVSNLGVTDQDPASRDASNLSILRPISLMIKGVIIHLQQRMKSNKLNPDLC